MSIKQERKQRYRRIFYLLFYVILPISVFSQSLPSKELPVVEFDKEIRKSRSAERKDKDSAYVIKIPEVTKEVEPGLVERLFKISELPDGGEVLPTTEHFGIGLPALPIENSAVILIGKVTSSSAHITEDRTGIYSEFSVGALEVLKQHLANIRVGQNIEVARYGGAVKFPSGKIQKYTVDGQAMPQVGQTYLLFLRIRKDRVEIVTGYDLSQNRVRPLDGEDKTGTFVDSPFARYRNVFTSEFLREVRIAVAEAKDTVRPRL